MSAGSLSSIIADRFRDRLQMHLPAGSLRARVASGAFWTLASRAAAQAITFAGSVLLARILGKDGFGEFGVVQSTLGLLSFVAGLGTSLTATKYVAELRDQAPRRVGPVLRLLTATTWVTGALTAIVLVAVSGMLAEDVFRNPRLTLSIQISSCMLLIGAIDGIQCGALAGLEAFRAQAWTSLAKGFVAVPLSVLATWLWGLEGAAVGLVCSGVLGLLVNRAFLHQEANRRGVDISASRAWRDVWAEANVLWTFALPACLQGGIGVPVQWLCTAIVVRQLGGFGEMAVFSAANQYQSAITFLLTPVCAVAVPILSNLLANGDTHRFRKFFVGHVSLNSGISLLCALPLCLASPWLMGLYGEGFREGWLTLVLISVATCCTMVALAIGYVIQSTGYMWAAFWVNFSRAVALLTAFWLFFRGMGAPGLAAATALAAFLQLLVHIAFLPGCFRRAGQQ